MSRVLVVDDDAHTRQIICHLLGQEGFETREAVNGRDALQQLTQWFPNLVIMDLRMPDMDGFETCRCIREMWGESGIPPIVILTGMIDRESVERASLAGADEFVIKPFRSAVVLEKVQKALARVGFLTEVEL